MKQFSKLRFILLGIILLLFIVFKVLKSEKITLYYLNKHITNNAKNRTISGVYPINNSWVKSIKTKKNDDFIEICYFDHDSLKTNHVKKLISVRPGYLFWKPFIYEEIDIFKHKKDSVSEFYLYSVYSHQYTHNEDPWGLSCIETKEYGLPIKNKQLTKTSIDSILNSWKKK